MTVAAPSSLAVPSPGARVAAPDAASWAERYRAVRDETERRAAPLSPEDQVVQSMPDASPTKWHRAHTTWFFEQFVLVPHAPGYRWYDERFPFLFNSYYVAAGPRHARPQRGLITRPDAMEVGAYRAHVDRALLDLLAAAPSALMQRLAPLLEIGLNHEQQHQELMLTDILHAFGLNPVRPSYDRAWTAPSAEAAPGAVSLAGVHAIGHSGDGFAFDNEGPRHEVLLQPVRVRRRLVTNGEWLAFMADDGYRRPELWLSDGWAQAQGEGWTAPGHWWEEGGAWRAMTLAGPAALDPDAPVRHVGFYEADAYARWAGAHLPSEAEWEAAARTGDLADAFGQVWQWTRSPYTPYPGYRPVEGALGEYNGKFMVNQMVLRGSSMVTPAGHSRPSYRNFFYPGQRWQFTGLRLADFA